MLAMSYGERIDDCARTYRSSVLKDYNSHQDRRAKTSSLSTAVLVQSSQQMQLMQQQQQTRPEVLSIERLDTLFVRKCRPDGIGDTEVPEIAFAYNPSD